MSDLAGRVAKLPPEKRILLARQLRAIRQSPASGRAILRQEWAPAPFNSPLSFSQERLLFDQLWEPESPLYNVTVAVHLTGPLNLESLDQCVNEVINRHDSLRTTISNLEGQYLQFIHPPAYSGAVRVDLSKLPAVSVQRETDRLIGEEARRPFDVIQDHLARFILLKTSRENFILLFTMHHIICDAWSIGLFIQEILTIYRGRSAGDPSPLTEPAIQYPDYIHWQRQWSRGEQWAKNLFYWKEELSGSNTVLELPTDYVRPSIQTFGGKRQAIDIPEDLAKAVKLLGQREEATLFMTLLAAFETLLSGYSGQDDFLVGMPMANRERPELRSTIGFYANTLVIRARLSGDLRFTDLLNNVRKIALGAYAHKDLDFENLVETLRPKRDLSRLPLFQVWFVLQNAPAPELELPQVTMSLTEVHSGVARYDLKLDLSETGQGLTGFFEYKSDLFYDSSIKQMANSFHFLLQNIVERPDIRLSEIKLMLIEDLHRQQAIKGKEFKESRRRKLISARRRGLVRAT